MSKERDKFDLEEWLIEFAVRVMGAIQKSDLEQNVTKSVSRSAN